MTYWVEYNTITGIRENLMTDSIIEARAKAYRVVYNNRRGCARIFASSTARSPEGSLRYTGKYYGMIWGVIRHGDAINYYILSDGTLHGKVKD